MHDATTLTRDYHKSVITVNIVITYHETISTTVGKPPTARMSEYQQHETIYLVSKRYEWQNDEILQRWQPLRKFRHYIDAEAFVRLCQRANPDASYLIEPTSALTNNGISNHLPIATMSEVNDNV